MIDINVGLAILTVGLLIFSFFRKSILIYIAIIGMCIAMIFGITGEQDTERVRLDNSVSSSIILPRIPNGATEYWISFFFVTEDDMEKGTTGENYYLFHIYEGSNDFGRVIIDDGVLDWRFKETVYQIIETGTDFEVGSNEIHHFLMSMSGTNGARILLDGNLMCTNADVSARGIDADVHIGGSYSGNSGINGTIFGISIGNDDLTREEELILANGEYLSDSRDIWYLNEKKIPIDSYGIDGNIAELNSGIDWSNYTVGSESQFNWWQIVFSIIMIWAILNLFRQENWRL